MDGQLDEDRKALQHRLLEELESNGISVEEDFEKVFTLLVAEGAMDRPGGNLMITLEELEKQLP